MAVRHVEKITDTVHNAQFVLYPRVNTVDHSFIYRLFTSAIKRCM